MIVLFFICLISQVVARENIVEAYLKATTTPLQYLTETEIYDCITVQTPDSVNPLSSNSIDSYVVYLREESSLYQFVKDIEQTFESSISIEFIGGQDKLLIIHCTISILASELMKNNVESFFSLPLLTRIENSVFERAAFSISNEKKENEERIILSVFPSSFSIFDNLKKPIQLSSHVFSKVMVNTTKSSIISNLVHSIYAQEHSPYLRSLQSTETTLADYFNSKNISIHSSTKINNSYEITGDYSSILSTLVSLTDHLSIQQITFLSLPAIMDYYPRRLNHMMREISVTGDYSPDNLSTLLKDHNLLGQGIIVGVGDTGLDYKSTFFYDSENSPVFGTTIHGNHRKIALYYDYSGKKDVDGHGTHVCGTIAGKATTDSSSLYNGLVPEARIMIFDFEDNNGNMVSVGSIENNFLNPFYTNGIRIINNSWGYENIYTYSSACYAVDRYIYNHDDFIVVFSAGNDGDKGSNTIASPALSKNVITVGSVGTRKSGYNTEDYVSYYSSRGPTNGRIKPDVCNVGTLSSAKSILEDECGNNCNNHEGVEIMSGTSMAAPSTTAAATILYQYLRDGYYSYSVPIKASLIKAMLIHSTTSVAGYCISRLNCYDFTDPTPPNSIQGFGRIVLENVLHFPETTGWDLFLQVATLNSTTPIHQYSFHLHSISSFKATLVWTDPVSSTSATNLLVNDLDLLLRVNSTSKIVYPNNLQEADHYNNVEVISVTSEQLRALTNGEEDPIIEIFISSSLLASDQEYSLVITGDFTVSNHNATTPTDLPFIPTQSPKNPNTSFFIQVIVIVIIFIIFFIILIIFLSSYVKKNKKRQLKKMNAQSTKNHPKEQKAHHSHHSHHSNHSNQPQFKAVLVPHSSASSNSQPPALPQKPRTHSHSSQPPVKPEKPRSDSQPSQVPQPPVKPEKPRSDSQPSQVPQPPVKPEKPRSDSQPSQVPQPPVKPEKPRTSSQPSHKPILPPKSHTTDKSTRTTPSLFPSIPQSPPLHTATPMTQQVNQAIPNEPGSSRSFHAMVVPLSRPIVSSPPSSPRFAPMPNMLPPPGLRKGSNQPSSTPVTKSEGHTTKPSSHSHEKKSRPTLPPKQKEPDISMMPQNTSSSRSSHSFNLIRKKQK